MKLNKEETSRIVREGLASLYLEELTPEEVSELLENTVLILNMFQEDPEFWLDPNADVEEFNSRMRLAGHPVYFGNREQILQFQALAKGAIRGGFRDIIFE